MSERERYKLYCDFCERIGVRAGVFEVWRKVSRSIPEGWLTMVRESGPGMDMGRQR